MVRLTTALVASLAATAVIALPVQKRIAQTIADSTAEWVKACDAAGGADQCNTISQVAFQTLLAAGKNCDQQDAADQMIDLAKKLDNDPEMIRLAQLFVQQPRNAPDSLQVPYCQTAPKNAELNGLFHCQFASSDFTKFSGDQTGNLPLGVSAVTPPGSCPAKTDGPVPDGVQLNTLVTSPGTVSKRSPHSPHHAHHHGSNAAAAASGTAITDVNDTIPIQLGERSPHSPHHAHHHGNNAPASAASAAVAGVDDTTPMNVMLGERSPHSPHHAHHHGNNVAAAAAAITVPQGQDTSGPLLQRSLRDALHDDPIDIPIVNDTDPIVDTIPSGIQERSPHSPHHAHKHGSTAATSAASAPAATTAPFVSSGDIPVGPLGPGFVGFHGLPAYVGTK
ncbi:hypothetical protein BV25DRAFT_1912070 [Artomyces pyxidatus]|uniref:Uncharacterized protein n=1 Tax=Artomyces pyxidatus TaxID=48021 RepID=A0ACB8TG96_9AGAM|nr:hypothetical protein BV25DRAFT_1912070 [Artomyces pyxidatus]